MGFSKARILEWVAMPSSVRSQPRDRICVSYVSCIGKQVLYHECHLECPEEIPKYKHISPKDMEKGKFPEL